MFYHADSGLYLTRYRAYDPRSARWLSRDPINERGGANLYAYVEGNPINYRDPSGLLPPGVGGLLGGALGDLLGQLFPPFCPAGPNPFPPPYVQSENSQDQDQTQQGPGDQSQQADDVPQAAKEVAKNASETGAPMPGYRGGQPFQNDGRGGGDLLPSTDADGNPITYQEWDVNPSQPDTNRGGDRVVTGSDGSAYYTNDHYGTFTRIK